MFNLVWLVCNSNARRYGKIGLHAIEEKQMYVDVIAEYIFGMRWFLIQVYSYFESFVSQSHAAVFIFVLHFAFGYIMNYSVPSRDALPFPSFSK